MATPASTNPSLSPKQLVFLFMAATVVAVVVFLCGVLVGRGVPLRQAADLRADGALAAQGADPLLPAVLDPVSSEPSPAAGAADRLSYYDRLEDDGAADESLRPASEPAPPAAPQARAAPPPAEPDPVPEPPPPAPAPAADPPPRRAAATDTTESPSSGYAYTVQVAALRAHEAAERVAGRLLAKGFPAYVVEPSPDAAVAVYRVRVGQYRDHGEAEQIRDRLEHEEQFKPWITR